MTKYFFIIGWLLTGSAIAQQSKTAVRLSHYVLDSFSKGRVQVKSGKVYEQSLNYNILTNEMVFDNDGKLLAIAKPMDVDTIFIQGRKFIPVSNKFYEVLTGTALPLMMEFTSKVEEAGASVGYGNASPTTNATSYSSLVSTGGVYDIKLPDDFKVTPGYTYWIKKDDKYLKAGNVKQLSSIFPDKKDFINEFVKKNNVNFSNKADMITLVQQIQH